MILSSDVSVAYITTNVALLLAISAPVLFLIWRVVYNLFLHPLRSYPGPLLWRASGLPIAYYTFVGMLPQVILAQHKKYGKEIRLAPDQLSFSDSRAWKDVFVAKPEFPKDARKFVYPMNGAHTILSAPRAEHARFRRLLSHAFSEKGLRSQEPLIIRYVDFLIERLHEETARTTSIDLVDWFTCVVFDIVGDLAWGDSFQGLQERRVHEWIPAILGNMKFINQVPLFREHGLDFLVPYLTDSATRESRLKNARLSVELTEKRAAYDGEPRGDFWDRVLIKSEDNNAKGEGMTKAEMANNAGSLVLAGAETSSTALSGTIYLLGKHPEILKRLVHEIRSRFENDKEITVDTVSNLPYMLAVLNESMRIYAPAPNQSRRISPSGGGMVCDKWVPEKVSIFVCQHAMNRSESNFARPDDFVPERWLPDAPAEFANDDRQAFQPFVLGSMNCIGRNLAYAEMRLILAKLLYNFDLALDAERTGDWFDQISFTVWYKKPLWIHLSKAQRASKQGGGALEEGDV